jgi:PTS system nitrogen regulatory IIA component
VSLMIFLLVPEKATQEHLEILSAIAQLLSDAHVREQLLTESDPQKVQQLICHWEA